MPLTEQASFSIDSLRAYLTYEPQELKFGTSGRRGEVIHLTQLEIYINALAELDYLQSLPRAEGGIVPGEEFYYAYDLRSSSTQLVPDQGGRGELAQAIERAIGDSGMLPVNLGKVPTPVLTYYALQHGRGSMMVTGSHIPFDRNGYKTNSSIGELLKSDEAPINSRVKAVRERLYNQLFEQSLFNEQGLFKSGSQALLPETDLAASFYVDRYLNFFKEGNLAGKRILVYQHSAVGRDLLVQILQKFGAEVYPVGRSDTFIPIDTEAIDQAQLLAIKHSADLAAKEGPFDAVISTDGDSDRPLIMSLIGDTGNVKFYGGDLAGMLTAIYLHADAVVVPINCNDAIDASELKPLLEPKTRIGSPYVIAGMKKAIAAGKQVVCGWEANGGFLLGSDISCEGRLLKALPTRDAMLPILCILFAAADKRLALPELFAALPKRFSCSTLLRDFSRSTARLIIEWLSPANEQISDVTFHRNNILACDARGKECSISQLETQRLRGIRGRIDAFFATELGTGPVTQINYTDGVRACFLSGEIAHVRASGNADEIRFYACADTQERADSIGNMATSEPTGLLRELERAVVPSDKPPRAILNL